MATSGIVTGVLVGLAAGNSLVLQNNTTDELLVDADGSFTFETALPDATTYAVAVARQPDAPSQTCTVEGASGTLTGDDVTSVIVTCEIDEFLVAGFVSGLAASNELVLQNNGDDTLRLVQDDPFVFDRPLPDQSNYVVTVATQPTDPNQLCTIENEAGVLAGEDIMDVAVDCATLQYTVGGRVSGLLAGNRVTLRNRGDDEIVLTENGPFSFPNALDDGTEYDVRVVSDPQTPPQICLVFAGRGNLRGSDVSDVVVTCDEDLLFEDGFEFEELLPDALE